MAQRDGSRDARLAAVRQAFPGADAAALLAVLDEYGSEPYERERERVQRAILHLAAGDAGRLRDLTATAKQDYRDVLFWAEYPEPACRRGQGTAT